MHIGFQCRSQNLVRVVVWVMQVCWTDLCCLLDVGVLVSLVGLSFELVVGAGADMLRL